MFNLVKPDFIPEEKEDAWQFLNDVKSGDKLSFKILKNGKSISLAKVSIKMIFKTDKTKDMKSLGS